MGFPYAKELLLEDFGGRRAEAQRFALPARAGYTVAVAVFVRIVHRAGATAEYNNGSDELLHGTTSSELKAGYTVDAHIEALVDERDVALLFRPGALFTPEGPVHCQVH